MFLGGCQLEPALRAHHKALYSGVNPETRGQQSKGGQRVDRGTNSSLCFQIRRGNGHKFHLRRFTLGTRKSPLQEAGAGLGQVTREGESPPL